MNAKIGAAVSIPMILIVIVVGYLAYKKFA